MRLFLDFDGTLIDSRHRLYQLFCRIVPDAGITFDDYWQMKRKGSTHRNILEGMLGFSTERIEAFEAEWMPHIEDADLLALDRPHSGVDEFLARAAKRHELYLITARQDPEAARAQLNRLGWSDLFTAILVTEQRTGKAKLIQSKSVYSNDDWMIGDTTEDIRSGKQLGLRTAGVTNGFREEGHLKASEPDLLLRSVTEFPI